MRRISVILFASLVVFASCDKRDLSSIETRLDNLENGLENANGRITTIEGTIDQINKDIESLQYLKAGMVINSVSGSDAAGWNITFANGKVVTVYPKDASTTIPLISISGDGYWMVDYGDGNGPIYLRNAGGERIPAQSAPGEPGKDGVTPVLGADGEGYWIVSYDGGQTFARLLDDKGNPVKARVSVGDSIFSGVVSDGKTVTFSLNDGSSFSCPIVAEFLCSIKGADGEVEFNSGETKTFTVEMKGIANAVVLCPSGWRAVLDDSSLKVTAPASTKGGSAVSFDSSSSVRILATSAQGYAVIAGFAVSIFVPAPEYDTFYEDWTKNGFVIIGGQKLKKEDFLDAKLLDDGAEISASGVYFVKEGATVTYPSGWGERFKQNTMIIGNSKTSRSKMVIAGSSANFYLSDKAVFVMKNMDITVTGNTQPLFMVNDTYTTPLFIADNCHVKCKGNAFFFSNKKQNFGTLLITGCDFRINSNDAYLGTIGNVEKLVVDNCIFYSKDSNICDKFVMTFSSSLDATVTNNTLVNVTRTGNGMFTGSVPNAHKNEFEPVIENNLRYYSSATPAGTQALGHYTLVADEGGTWYNWGIAKVASDYVFVNGGNTNGSVFRGLLNPAVASTMLASSPFSSMDFSTGTFVNTTKYGAQR